ncbi:MAG TPA: universal stress protein [Ferruginibacter sp.]|nr:universal stress protein [Ferruginibacter sp.]HRO05643.1 universal stress protein [Ferruginibacter sp.]HRO95814.1 universal stress protein [Ferruginibacter sp.]HRP49177.1 universal stress protein [Ferruginibacter sp.]
MQQIIVPLDFSETSFNAAEFTADMYSHRNDVTITLYHFYESEEDMEPAKQFMKSLRERLGEKYVYIETYIETGNDFVEQLAAFAASKRARLIVMGLTGKTALAQRFSGSNTLKMVEEDVCPVLIIPPDVRYKKIQNVLIASEMRLKEETPALLAVKEFLKDIKPAVHILNVDSSHYISLTSDFKESRDKMEAMLAEFKPEFYFMRLFDFHESINLFSKDKQIDLIIIAPKQHSFFTRLFKTQHTKTLIYQSTIPVLAIKD